MILFFHLQIYFIECQIHMDTPSGKKDAIPAWIKFAVQAPGEIPYNGIYYDPPLEVTNYQLTLSICKLTVRIQLIPTRLLYFWQSERILWKSILKNVCGSLFVLLLMLVSFVGVPHVGLFEKPLSCFVMAGSLSIQAPQPKATEIIANIWGTCRHE